MQSDPIGLRGGINTYTYVDTVGIPVLMQGSTYSYVGANPISRTDPLGLMCKGTGCWTTPSERDYLSKGDFLGYYRAACAGEDKYACFALHIASADTVEGWLATFRVSHALNEHASEHHQCGVTSDVLNRIRNDLANAYANYLPSSEDNARFPVAADVAKFHWDEFAKFGLSPETFGGTPFGGSTWFSGHWCPNCK